MTSVGMRALARRVVVFGLCVVCLASPAMASAQIFPVKSSLVPMVVAAAFILPAGLAAVWSIFRRWTRHVNPVLGASVLAMLAMVAFAYARPDLLTALRI